VLRVARLKTKMASAENMELHLGLCKHLKGNGGKAKGATHKNSDSEKGLELVEDLPKNLEEVFIRDLDKFTLSGKMDARSRLVSREVPNYRVKFDRRNFVYSFTIYL